VSDAGTGTGVPDVVRRPSRLRALAELGANAQSSAEALDRIGRIACHVLQVPVALVNLVGADRQRFVGCAGPEPWSTMREMPLDAGFCPFALGAEVAYTLDDARTDPVLAANPAVEQLGVVAYAGVPLRTAGGEPIGTLCALDRQPRAWSRDDLTLLADLAEGVIAELQLLTATRMLAQDRARLRELTNLSSALAPAEQARDVIDEICRTTQQLHAQAVWVSLVDETGQVLRAAAAGGPERALAARQADVPITAPVAPAEVLRTGRPDFLSTRAEVQDRFAGLFEAMPSAGSVAVVPLSAGGAQIGVLGVSFADERPLPDADRDYLTAVGAVSALALARKPA